MRFLTVFSAGYAGLIGPIATVANSAATKTAAHHSSAATCALYLAMSEFIAFLCKA